MWLSKFSAKLGKSKFFKNISYFHHFQVFFFLHLKSEELVSKLCASLT
jgi:hypothetical protein